MSNLNNVSNNRKQPSGKRKPKRIPQQKLVEAALSTYPKYYPNRRSKNNSRKDPKKLTYMMKKSDNNTSPSSLNTWKSMLTQGIGKTLMMNPDVRNFLLVYTDPFRSIPARLPVWPTQICQLVRVVLNGQGTSGSDGTLFVMFSSSRAVMNDQPAVEVSKSTSAGVIFSSESTNYTVPGPYDSTYFNPDLNGGVNAHAFRVVSSGCRVRFTGTAFNSGGKIRCVRNQPREIDLTGTTYNGCATIPGYKEYDLTNQWKCVTRQITDSLDYRYIDWQAATDENNNFSGTYYVDTNDLSYDDRLNIGILGKTAAPTQPFEFEISVHYEVIGQSLAQPSRVMPQTHKIETSTTALQNLSSIDSTTPDHNVGGTEAQLIKKIDVGHAQSSTESSVGSTVGTLAKIGEVLTGILI